MTIIGHILFSMLYGGVAVAAVVACLYLLLRRGNAFAADITPPMALRRWTAAFFAVVALGHVWWFFFYVCSRDTHSATYFVIVVLDYVTLIITISGILLSMLQDRKRPLWPVLVAMLPIVMLGGMQIARPDSDFTFVALLYIMSLCLLFTVYIVIAVRQYGRWLRDNYADLEHKEVWISHALIMALMLLLIFYEFATDSISFFLLQLINLLLFCLLLWRVETLPQLDGSSDSQESVIRVPAMTREPSLHARPTTVIPPNISMLLAEHCVDAQLYLQHDLTLAQLAAAVGVNRYYLSQYFSSQGLNYNTYINSLRINYFIGRYHESVASQQPFTAQQLASDSGYRSYSTFSLAFKQRMGQSVTAWMRETPEH